MTVRTRLLLTLAAVATSLALPALYAATRLADVRQIAVQQRIHHTEAFLDLGRLKVSIAELDRYLRSYVAAPGPELQREMASALDASRTWLRRLDESGYRSETRASRALLERIRAAVVRIDTLIGADSVTAASGVLEQIKPMLREIDASLDGIATAIDARSRRDLEAARAISASAARTIFLATGASALLALALGLWSTRALVTPLRRLRSAVAAVAEGEFVAAADLPYERRDEIGDLSRSFRSTTEHLAELERIRAEFLSMASHDLKTPISVIVGYRELLEDGIYGPVNVEQKDALATIQEQSEVLIGLVNQLVDIGRLQAGGLRIERVPTDVEELLDAVERAFGALAERQRIRFAVLREATTPATVAADTDRLRDQVLGNLLGNAFKFTPAGGSIQLRAWGEDERLLLEVSDTGTGIPPDRLPHIFEKYYQVGGKARRVGAGLGLAIVRDVVQAHNGTVHVESRPGQGTTFQVAIPAADEVAAGLS